MQKNRRARAIAIAKADDGAMLVRYRPLLLAVGATAALLALPVLF